MIRCIFSDVVESPIYRAIVNRLEASDLDVDYGIVTDGSSPFADWLTELREDTDRIEIGSTLRVLNAWKSMYAAARRDRPDALVCFGQTATLLGFTASVGTRAPRRLYARYHSTTHSIEGNRRGLAYDRLCNRLADMVVAPNGNVVRALVEDEGLDPEQVVTIPFGIRLSDFAEPPADRVDAVRHAHGIDPDRTTIGMVSRLIEIKGWRYALDPIRTCLEDDAGRQLVIANAVGDLEPEVRQALDRVSDQVIYVRHEPDNAALFGTFDVFVHVPVTPTVEAFGLVYVEALAAGIPSVFTRSGIANDFAEDGRNCLVVPHRDAAAIGLALDRILTSDSLRSDLRGQAIASVQQFQIEPMADAYVNLLHQLDRDGRAG